MNTRKRLSLFLSLIMLLIALTSQSVFAVPANKTPVTHVRKDGSSITVIKRGDEFFHFYTDDKGNLLVRGEDGDYLYAIWDGEKMTTSPLPQLKGKGSGISGFTDTDMKAAYAKLSGFSYDPSFRVSLPDPVTPDMLRGNEDGAEIQSITTPTETLPLVTIIVSFNNIGYDTSFDWFNDFFGQEDSLFNFYYEFSGKKFSFRPAEETCEEGNYDKKDDGIIHVRLNRNHGKWSDLTDEKISDELNDALIDALEAADNYIDYKRYDKNGDNIISNNELAICFILAGYEAATDDPYSIPDDNKIWSHRYEIIYEGKDKYIGKNNIRISDYIAMPDRLTIDTQEPLGVVYHELGHYLGLPDLYDTKYLEESDDPAEQARAIWKGYDMDALSIMSGGSWATDSKGNPQPTGFDAWSRFFLRWINPEYAYEDGEYELRSQYSENSYNTLLIDTQRDNEFFLLENRRCEGLDSGLYNSYKGITANDEPISQNGIIVWHIDDSVRENYENTVNDKDHRPGIMPVFAEGLFDDDSGSFTEYNMDFKGTRPDRKLAFFSRSNFEKIYKNVDGYEEGILLPVFGDGTDADDPDKRMISNINLCFTSDDSREMTVSITRIPYSDPAPEEKEIKPLSELLTKEELADLDSNFDAHYKNSILKKVDSAIEDLVRSKKTVSFDSAIKGTGKNASTEYWVLLSMNKALRYDGRNHVINTSGKSSKSKNRDLEIRVLYCEKKDKYADAAPSGNEVTSDGWKEAKVKKAVIKNAKNALFDYTGNKLNSITGFSKAPYLASITLEDKALNKTLGKALNKKIKDLAKKLKSDKSSTYTDGDLDKPTASEEQRLIIPIYPLFTGIYKGNANYTDGNLKSNEYTFYAGVFDDKKGILEDASVSIKYNDGASKDLKLTYNRNKDKDYKKETKTLEVLGKIIIQLTATGNYFGFNDYK